MFFHYLPREILRKLTKFSVSELTLLILLWKWMLYIFCFLFSRFPITFMKFPLILYFFVTCRFFRRTILLATFANVFLCCKKENSAHFISKIFESTYLRYILTIYTKSLIKALIMYHVFLQLLQVFKKRASLKKSFLIGMKEQ